MRILDEKRDTSVERAVLLLTRAEAEELRDSLESLLAGSEGRHEHVPSENHKKEISIAIYVPGSAEGFSERCQKLIYQDI